MTITGEVDMASVDELSVAFDAARRGQHGDITADVSAVDFIDASALRVLLDTHRYLRDDGRRLTLQSPSAAVLRLLRLAGLDGSLQMTGETGDARRSSRAYRWDGEFAQRDDVWSAGMNAERRPLRRAGE